MKQVLVTLGALACLACSPGDHDESRSSALATEPRIPPAPRVPGEPPPSVVDPSPSSFVVTGEILRQEEQRDRDRVAATTDVRAWLSRIRKTTELAVVATPIGAERVGPDNVHMQDFVVETSLFGSPVQRLTLAQSDDDLVGCSTGLHAFPATRYVMLLRRRATASDTYELVVDGNMRAWLVEETHGSKTFARGPLVASPAEIATGMSLGEVNP